MASRNVNPDTNPLQPTQPTATDLATSVISHEAPGEEEHFQPAAIDRRLSYHRQKAANFKKLAPEVNKDYRRVHIASAESSDLDLAIASKIRRAIALREKWLYNREVPEWLDFPEPRHSDYTVFVPPPYDPFEPNLAGPSEHVCHWKDGIVAAYSDKKCVMRRKPQFHGRRLVEYAQDLSELTDIINDPECRSFCYRRLVLLQERFNMYIILNEGQERLAQIAVPHRDLYNVRKVDVHGKLLIWKFRYVTNFIKPNPFLLIS